jgi:hypothetical protein
VEGDGLGSGLGRWWAWEAVGGGWSWASRSARGPLNSMLAGLASGFLRVYFLGLMVVGLLSRILFITGLTAIKACPIFC